MGDWPTGSIEAALADPAFIDRPYPVYRRLLAEAPIWRAPTGDWVLSRHPDVSAVSMSHRQFGQMRRGLDSFVFLNPPEHTRLRSLVARAFTPRAITKLRARIQEVVDGLIDDVAADGNMELISQFATIIPTTIITEMLGVPLSDGDIWNDWAQTIHLSTAAPRFLPEQVEAAHELVANAARAARAEEEYFAEIVTERRLHPGYDIISTLAEVEEQGDRLSTGELLQTCVLILGGGHHTSIHLIGNTVKSLLEHPDQLERLHHSPELVDNAIEESMRCDSPLQTTHRVVREDADVAGQPLAEGENVHLILGAANRDPAVFDDPERFDIGRPNAGKHVAFGLGVHFCLGAALARAEGQVAIGTLVRRLEGLRLDGPVEPDGLYNFRGLARLPLAWDAVAPA
jgi:cytochrome P450